MTIPDFSIDRRALADVHAQEIRRFVDTHPRSMALAAEDAEHYLFGVPLHWMRDWPTPAALHVQRAEGNRLWCADGHEYIDFCLGDTGAMFGHSPAPVARAIAEQSQHGLTAMLPSTLTAEVGRRRSASSRLARAPSRSPSTARAFPRLILASTRESSSRSATRHRSAACSNFPAV